LFFFSSLWILLQPLASTSGLSSIATTNSWKKSYRRQQKTNFNFPNSIPVTTFSTIVWLCQMWVTDFCLFLNHLIFIGTMIVISKKSQITRSEINTQ
jgi:hypothetical protein